MAAYQRRITTATPFISTSDGSITLLKEGDDEGSVAGGGTCNVAQGAAGVVLAFMLASLGYILSGDSVRSLFWWAGLVAGATTGIHATRTSVGTEEGDPTLERLTLISTMGGAIVGATLYVIAFPPLTLDNLMASFATATAAYMCQGLSTEEGRARATLQLRTLAADAESAWRSIVKGSGAVSSSGGGGVIGASGGAAIIGNGSYDGSGRAASSALLLPLQILQPQQPSPESPELHDTHV